MDTTDTPGSDINQPDYEVGRNRPPKHTQFQKGNTLGRGRPAGSPNAKTAFNNAFAKKKRVKLDGREQSRSKGEIAMEQLANKAASGDTKAIQTYLSYSDKWYEEEVVRQVPRHEQELNLSVIDNLLALKSLAERGLASDGPETRDEG